MGKAGRASPRARARARVARFTRTRFASTRAGEDAASAAYVEALDSMHKVVLQVKNEAALRKLSAKLDEAGVRHKLWIEQPEGIPTCLATKPYYKEDVAIHFKKLRLCS